ncbi:hypothetical protein [Agrococcus baldri]|uniref:Uncharacterized protein n=1 Tax=Agrococcus baldri TaxID=153730 RepID=A0AA87USP0_9MICO|nr:hypothetical protein [Agrococcus baldri]GEK80580.1 hypothetical protein ABA31_19310 [Agrococcus baldri]
MTEFEDQLVPIPEQRSFKEKRDAVQRHKPILPTTPEGTVSPDAAALIFPRHDDDTQPHENPTRQLVRDLFTK